MSKNVKIPRTRREVGWHADWDEADNINFAEVLVIIVFSCLLVWVVFG